MFANGSEACPTTAMKQMLEGYPPHLKKGESDALFTLSSGKTMGREEWIPFAQDLTQQVGLEGEEYDGISPRKGGAQGLRMVGTPNDIIRVMGRWAEHSFVFETYQAVSTREMESYARKMAAATREELIAQGKAD